MQPFSRETITDRRQPYVRWTPVIAGALVALGTWMLLQLLFTGGALSAIDPDEIDNLRGYGIGTSLGSVLAPLLAMFVGGLVAGRLAAYYDQRVSAFHGVLVWTIASVLGLALLGAAIGSLVNRDHVAVHTEMSAPPPGAADFVDSTVASINARQRHQNAPQITKDQFLDAAHFAIEGRDAYDRSAFVARLDEQTKLSRPEAESVLDHLGDGAGDVMIAADQLAVHRMRALDAAEDAGKGMLGAGFALLLCLVSAAGGAVLGSRMLKRGAGGGGHHHRRRDGRGIFGKLFGKRDRGDRDLGDSDSSFDDARTSSSYDARTSSSYASGGIGSSYDTRPSGRMGSPYDMRPSSTGSSYADPRYPDAGAPGGAVTSAPPAPAPGYVAPPYSSAPAPAAPSYGNDARPADVRDWRDSPADADQNPDRASVRTTDRYPDPTRRR